MRDVYQWPEDAYRAVAASGVPVWSAMYVLYHSRPCVRSHLGAVLRIFAPDQTGRWMVVALIEKGEVPDTYDVVGARWLDPDEQAAVETTLKGETDD